LSDLLRAALVLAVSALDYYVHEVVTLGVLEIHRGQRSEPNPPTNSSQSAFSRFQVSLGAARQERLIAIDIASWLENEIQQNQGSSFLQQSYLVSALLPVISSSILNKLNNASWLEDEVRERLSYQSFQQPDKIGDAIRLISDKKLWDEVATKIGKPAKDVKQQLSAIVDRRNKIAHEADIDPTFGIGSRWSINEILVNDAVNFIEQVVESIHQIL
jgi:RiboL-PSP-HEPN